jgi:hypothetical protein
VRGGGEEKPRVGRDAERLLAQMEVVQEHAVSKPSSATWG